MREVVRGDKHHLRKSANYNAQISVHSAHCTDLCFAICRLIFSGCVCHLEQLHAPGIIFVDSPTGLESLIAGVSNDKKHNKRHTLVNAGGGGGGDECYKWKKGLYWCSFQW